MTVDVGCGAPDQATSLGDLGLDLTKESVIQGVVTRGGDPVGGAYVRLLDRSGEFAAEVPTTAAGAFRFFAAPGQWRLRALAPRSEPAEAVVQARRGEVAQVELTLAG